MRTALTVLFTILPIAARAQTIPPACRPLVAAAKKQIMTPHHLYQTEGPERPGGKLAVYESISTGGATYILIGGTWKRSPLGQKEDLDRMEENLRTATAYSCQRVGDESVGGVPTVVYTSHVENQGVRFDARTWIATATGLILRQEEDMQTGEGAGTRHMSMRWEYTNVQPPAGVGAP